MISNGINTRSYQGEVSTQQTMPQEAAKSSSLADTLIFPNSRASTTDVHFMTRKMPIEDSLIQELDQILYINASQIEKELKELENSEENKQTVEAILQAETFHFELANSTSETVQAGLEFLKYALPEQVMASISPHQRLEKLGGIISLGTAFLSALDTGSQGLALIYKSKFLQQSKELLEQLKITYKQELGSEAEIKNFLQKLEEWDIWIKLEEENLSEEKLQFTLSLASNGLFFLSLPSTYLPKEWIIDPLQIAPPGLSEAISGLELIALGIELKKTAQKTDELQHWVDAYKKWQDQHQPKFKIAENILIQTSQNLLAKRQAIVEEKVLMLKPHFDTVKAKISEFKQSAFLRDIQQLLWEKLQDPHCPFQEIETQFKYWGFFDADRASQNQFLIQAFEKFKNFKLQQNAEGIPPEQKALVNVLAQWMNSPAMEGQFKHWFDTQPKEDLLCSYVDHQETLEHTTKNALKQMVQQKYAIESHLQNFQLTKSRIEFSVAAIALAASATLAILGLLSVPVAGASLILLGFSIGSFAINFGLSRASSYQLNLYKPKMQQILTLSFETNMVWTKLRNVIQIYFHQAKEKKLLEVAKILYKLHSAKENAKTSAEYQKALADYKNAKLEFENSQKKVNHWVERLQKLEITLNQEAWKDFAQSASLQVDENSHAFDTLQAFQEALQASDLRLLSPETRTLLELQLGIDLKALQAQISKEPETIKNALKEFFTMEDSELLAFIRNQTERANKGLLQSQLP